MPVADCAARSLRRYKGMPGGHKSVFDAGFFFQHHTQEPFVLAEVRIQDDFLDQSEKIADFIGSRFARNRETRQGRAGFAGCQERGRCLKAARFAGDRHIEADEIAFGSACFRKRAPEKRQERHKRERNAQKIE
jgi:hypothetical protein